MGWTPAPMDFRWDGVRHSCHDCKFKDVQLPDEPCGECFKTMPTVPFSRRVAKFYSPADPGKHYRIKVMLKKYKPLIREMLSDLKENGLSIVDLEYQLKKNGL